MKTRLLAFSIILSMISCTTNPKENLTEVAPESDAVSNYVKEHINFQRSDVPKGPTAEASKMELYALAWQQFIALNWPAKGNIDGNRAVPNGHSDSTFLKVTPSVLPTVVWNTYASKAEIFNFQNGTLPEWSSLGKPVYQYKNQPTPLNSSERFDLFNNLDENNEIGEAVVFGGAGKGNTSGGDQVLYEAKINEAEYSYIRKYKLQNAITAANWGAKTIAKLDSFGGTCLSEEAAAQEIICFPCADENSEGAIEIKAAWRKLNANDTLSHYYVQNVLVYKHVGGTRKYTNQAYGLIGLHIIRKTKNYPTFIFTTFNHVDNINSGVYYNNSLALEGQTPPFYQYFSGTQKNQVPDTTYDPNHKYIQLGNIAVTSQGEVHKIPSELQKFNAAVQSRIKAETNNQSVWQYYELLGVQAVPTDLANAGSDESYYLANDVIETDYTLRRFTGAFGNPTGILLDFQNINKKGKTYSMGGCMGCHGNAQVGGHDFSFLLGNDTISAPDTLGIPKNVN